MFGVFLLKICFLHTAALNFATLGLPFSLSQLCSANAGLMLHNIGSKGGSPFGSPLWGSLREACQGSSPVRTRSGSREALTSRTYGCERGVLKRLCLSQKRQVSRKGAFSRHLIASPPTPWSHQQDPARISSHFQVSTLPPRRSVRDYGNDQKHANCHN